MWVDLRDIQVGGSSVGLAITRDGQHHTNVNVYMVYIRYVQQGSYRTYSHIRCTHNNHFHL